MVESNRPTRIKSKADVRRNGYRRGKQPKYEPYMFAMSSESVQLGNHMIRAGFTRNELGEAAQAVFYDSLENRGLFINNDGDVCITPKIEKKIRYPKVDLDKIKGFNSIALV